MSRFVVTEIEGYLDARVGGGKPPGISTHVIDTAWNRRLVATYRSEDWNQIGRAGARERVRTLAAQTAARLNADLT